MGSDAVAYIFDENAYRNRVVPALRQFVQTGATDRWLAALLSQLSAEQLVIDLPVISALGFSFDTDCHYLGTDFAFSGSEPNQWSYDWKLRACPSAICPAMGACPLHESRQLSAAEEFNFLVAASVVDQCLGPGQFVGRTVSPMWYSDCLTAAGFGPTHSLFDYLRALEYRGYVVGYQFANSDGIHGWLTASETKVFHSILQELDLPQFEPSFFAMEGFRQERTYVPPPTYSFVQLSLAFLRTVAAMAVAEGRGLLWGNDLPTYLNDERPKQEPQG